MVANYLALRTIKRDRKRYILLAAAIAVLLAATIAVSVIIANSRTLSAVNEEILGGRWHMAYVASDTRIVERLESNAVVAHATLGYRLKGIPTLTDDFELSITLYEREKLALFTRPLLMGEYPRGQREVIVPDWVLRKYDISLPGALTLDGMTVTITGVYKGRAIEQVFKTIPAFGIIEENEDLLDSQLLAGTPGRTYFADFIAGKPRFVYIRLASGVKVEDAVRSLSFIPGLVKFNEVDMFSKQEGSPCYNVGLVQAEGRFYSSTGGFPAVLPWLVRLVLLGTLFGMVFVVMNVVVHNNISTLGLYAALGMNPPQTRNHVILQALYCALPAIPLGAGLGVGGAYAIFGGNVADYIGRLFIPWPEVGLSIGICFAAIVAGATLPALVASRLSPLSAMSYQRGVSIIRNEAPPWLRLDSVRGKGFAAVIYGVKNIFKDLNKLIGITLVIAALLSLFILIAADIEREWKVGYFRFAEPADYVVSVPCSRGGYFNHHVKEVDEFFRESLRAIPEIDQIYYQSGVVDAKTLLGGHEGVYHYVWKLRDEALTPYFRSDIQSSYPGYRSQSPGYAFIPGGVSGYGPEELGYAKRFLVEGDIDIKRMAAEPIILLPKYITEVENLNLPYTTLRVGDQLRLVEMKLEGSSYRPTREYTFTIGGFVDPLPLPRVNGMSSFTGIMHADQLSKLQTIGKGTMGIYVFDKPGQSSYSRVKELSVAYGYEVWGIQESFVQKERKAEYAQMQMVAYSLFSVLAIAMFLGVFSIFSAEILARKQEFAMLYSIGMTKGQIFLSVLSQGLTSGILGCVTGILLGVFLISQIDWPGILSLGKLVPVGHIFTGVLLILGACLTAVTLSVFQTVRDLSVQNVKGVQ